MRIEQGKQGIELFLAPARLAVPELGNDLRFVDHVRIAAQRGRGRRIHRFPKPCMGAWIGFQHGGRQRLDHTGDFKGRLPDA